MKKCQHNNPAHAIQYKPKGRWFCGCCGKDITGISIKLIVKNPYKKGGEQK